MEKVSASSQQILENETQVEPGGDIEIPWHIVREFSKSTLPLHQRIRLSINSASPDYNGYREMPSYTRFPSLLTSHNDTGELRKKNYYKFYQDRFNEMDQKKMKVPCTVLQTYVVEDGAKATLKKSFTSSDSFLLTSPISVHRTKSHCNLLLPNVKQYKKPNTNILNSSSIKIREERRNSKNYKKSNTSTSVSTLKSFDAEPSHRTPDFPKLSPVQYLKNYQQTWSMDEDRKLANMWKQGPALEGHFNNKDKNKRITFSDEVKSKTYVESEAIQNSPDKPRTKVHEIRNHMYQFSKQGGNRNNSIQVHNDSSSKIKVNKLERKSELPSNSSSVDNYIMTWLEAGGDIPCFVKAK